MANRRLHHEQPASFAFNAENEAWAEMVIKRYPPGREASAVIPLLWRGQEQEGWVSKPMIESVAAMLGMADIRVLEVATFYTMFHLKPVGSKAHIQVCGTTPCMLRGSEELIAICRSRIAPHSHELSADGSMSWEEVECLGACVNAPMVQVFKDTYEDLTGETFNALIDAFAAGEPPKPGPQNGRQFSAAEGGETTLTDPALYDGSVVGRYKVPEAVSANVSPSPAASETPKPVASAKADPPKPAASAKAETPKPAAPKGDAPSEPKSAPKAPAAVPGSSGPSRDRTASPGKAKVRADAEDEVSDEHKPTFLAAARGGKPDDLKLIWGVGPKLEAMLHDMGVFHFDQIAEWTDTNLRWVDQNLGSFKGRAVRDKWIEQAAKLKTGWRPAEKAGEKPE